MLKTYQPGQRLVFERNPRYWRKDERGQPLPALDRLTLEIVPDQNAELLALQTGQIDFTQTEVRPEDYATLKRAADAKKLTHPRSRRRPRRRLVLDEPAAEPSGGGQAAVAAARRAARAISHAVDRRAFAETVFLGAAVPVYGPITPGNQRWYAPDLPKSDYDPAAARRLLAGLGLSDRDGDGMLEDRSGAPAGFTILTQKGTRALERGAAFIARGTEEGGARRSTVAALDGGAAIDRIERGDYDAVYFRFLTTDLDPALNIELWVSSGSAHVWNPGAGEAGHRVGARDGRADGAAGGGARPGPAQGAVRPGAADRRRAVADDPVRRAPHLRWRRARASSGATPALLRPSILWNPDTLAVR